MTKSVWIVLTLAGLAIPAAQDGRARPASPADDTLIVRQRALHDAVAKGDKPAFLSLVGADGTWTTPQGFVPMKLLADGLDGFRLTKWDIVNPRVIPIGNDAAVVLYVWSVSGRFGEQPLPASMLASTVWARRDGTWVAVHHQETELRSN